VVATALGCSPVAGCLLYDGCLCIARCVGKWQVLGVLQERLEGYRRHPAGQFNRMSLEESSSLLSCSLRGR